MSAAEHSPARRKLFVTTALPYANGPFHVGHIMEYIQADIWVRFQRMCGHEVHFVCADDTHGAAIMLRAESDGVTPAGTRCARHRDAAEDAEWLPYQLRSLAFDRFAGKRRIVAGHLSSLEGKGSHLHQARRAVLRSSPGDVPAGPLHQGHVSEMRHQGSVRRRLRESAARSTRRPTSSTRIRRLTGARPELRTSDHLFFRLSAPPVVAFLASGRVKRVAAGSVQQDPGMAGRQRQTTGRLGHLARRAVRRHPDS